MVLITASAIYLAIASFYNLYKDNKGLALTDAGLFMLVLHFIGEKL